MSFSFNKSSLLASIEILNDKHFKKYNDLKKLNFQKIYYYQRLKIITLMEISKKR